MVSIKKRKIANKTFYYLQHSYRVNGTVCNKQRYLGNKIPKNIDKIKQDFLIEIYKKRWYSSFDKIKYNFIKEKNKIPKSLEKKDMENFAIKFTYATNRMEGSTLTLMETANLLEKGISPSQRPIEDIKETEAHRELFYEVISYDKEITLATLLYWHKTLFQQTKKDTAGKIRDHRVGISGSKYKPATAIELDFLLQEFFDWYKNNKKKLHPIHLAALVHLKFVTIHPFGDGNGRISRLFMNYVLHKYGYPMLVIDYSQRNSYYTALERSQLQKDESVFIKWFFRRYLKEFKKYLK